MNIIFPLKTTFIDYPDNESEAILIFFMGCDNNCSGCHNINFKNYNYKNAKVFSPTDLKLEIDKLSKRINSNKVVLTGGDPLSKFNINEIKQLTIILKNYNLMIYTGHDIEYVKRNEIKNFAFIKCGIFDINQKQISEKNDIFFKLASKNQQLYDADYNLISNTGVYYFNN